jgi:peroxiredoxin
MKLLTVFFQTIVLISVTTASYLQSPSVGLRKTPVAVGEVAPDFVLQDQNGGSVSLADARSKSPVVLVFYRGYW